VQLGGGAFGAARATAQWASGLRDDGTALQARFSNQRAEGYRAGRATRQQRVPRRRLVRRARPGEGHAAHRRRVERAGVHPRAARRAARRPTRQPDRRGGRPLPADARRGELHAPAHADRVAGHHGVRLRRRGSLRLSDVGAGDARPALGAGVALGRRAERAPRARGAPRSTRGVARRSRTAATYALPIARPGGARLRQPREQARRGERFVRRGRALGALTAYGDLQARGVTFRLPARPTARPVPTSDASWTFVNPRARAYLAARRRYGCSRRGRRHRARADAAPTCWAGADDIAPDDADALLPLTARAPRARAQRGGGRGLARGRVGGARRTRTRWSSATRSRLDRPHDRRSATTCAATSGAATGAASSSRRAGGGDRCRSAPRVATSRKPLAEYRGQSDGPGCGARLPKVLTPSLVARASRSPGAPRAVLALPRRR
jgi:hypothetical protein